MERSALSDVVTIRPTSGKVLTVAVGLVGAFGLVSLFTEGGLHELARFGVVGLAGVYLCWMLFWFPSVTVGPAGVTIRNIARTHQISWPAVVAVETRYALTVRTTTGKFVAWSAPSPGRYAGRTSTAPELRSQGKGPREVALGDIPRSESGLAALVVRQRWDALKAAGYLDSGAIEGTGVVTRWNAAVLGCAGGVLALGLLLAILL